MATHKFASRQQVCMSMLFVPSIGPEGRSILCNFSCLLGTNSLHLYNNVYVKVDSSTFHNNVLQNAGISLVKDIVRKGRLISFRNVARKCQP